MHVALLTSEPFSGGLYKKVLKYIANLRAYYSKRVSTRILLIIVWHFRCKEVATISTVIIFFQFHVSENEHLIL